MGNGPKIFIPIDDGSLASLRNRVKELRSESRAANKEMQDLKSTGQQVTRDVMERIDKAKAALKLGTREFNEVSSADREKWEGLHEAHITEKLGMKFQRVFAGNFMQKLARGEPLDFGDVLREARGAEKFVEKGLRAVGVKSADLGMLGLTLTLGLEAYEKWKEALKEIASDKKIASNIGKEFGRGLLSEGGFELFQQRFQAEGGEKADAFLKKVEAIGGDIDLLSPDAVAKTISKARSKLGTGGEWTGQYDDAGVPIYSDKVDVETQSKELIDAINKGMEQKRKDIGGPLTKETEKQVQKAIVDAFFAKSDLGQNLINEVLDSLQEQEKDKLDDERKKHLQKPLFMVIQERRQKQIYEVQSAVMDKRVPAMPND